MGFGRYLSLRRRYQNVSALPDDGTPFYSVPGAVLPAPNPNPGFYHHATSGPLFIDCVSVLTTELNPVYYPEPSSSTIQPFDKWWCLNYGGYRAYNEPPLFYGFNASVRSYCYSLEKSAYSSYYRTTTSQSLWVPPMTPPCCDPACHLTFGDAQVLYWPRTTSTPSMIITSPAMTPAIATFVSDGFTYTSPSVYVVYKSVYAIGHCSTVGNSYSAITVSYAPGELKSYRTSSYEQTENVQSTDLRPFNFADLEPGCPTFESKACPTLTDIYTTWEGYSQATASQVACLNSLFSEEAAQLSGGGFCTPLLAFPSHLTSYDPAWSTCYTFPGTVGIYDPPRVLGKASLMAYPTPASTEVPPEQDAASATPAPTLKEPIASKTDSASSTSTTNDPGSGNMPALSQDNVPASSKVIGSVQNNQQPQQAETDLGGSGLGQAIYHPFKQIGQSSNTQPTPADDPLTKTLAGIAPAFAGIINPVDQTPNISPPNIPGPKTAYEDPTRSNSIAIPVSINQESNTAASSTSPPNSPAANIPSNNLPDNPLFSSLGPSAIENPASNILSNHDMPNSPPKNDIPNNDPPNNNPPNNNPPSTNPPKISSNINSPPTPAANTPASSDLLAGGTYQVPVDSPISGPIDVEHSIFSLPASASPNTSPGLDISAPNNEQSSAIAASDANVISGSTTEAGMLAVTTADQPTPNEAPTSTTAVAVVLNGQTHGLFSLQDVSASMTATVAGYSIAAFQGSIAVDGTIINPGSSAVTIAGTPVRLDASSDLVIGQSTETGLSSAITKSNLPIPSSQPGVGINPSATVGVITNSAAGIHPTTLIEGAAGKMCNDTNLLILTTMIWALVFTRFMNIRIIPF